MKELWESYKAGGIKWKYEIVKYVISNPDSILKDNNLWNEFKLYIKDLCLYDFDITDNIDRLMVVKTVAIQLYMILKDEYKY